MNTSSTKNTVNQTDTTAPALHRGLMVLELLQHGKWLSLEKIANELELPKSSLSRILDTLVAWQYVERDPGSKKFHTQVLVSPLSSRQANFRERIQQVIDGLGARIQLTVEWYLPKDGYAVITQRYEETQNTVTIRAQIGHRRSYFGEFDSVCRIAHAAKAFGMPKPGDDTKHWYHSQGKRCELTHDQVSAMSQALGDHWLCADEDFNDNGIRRLARGIKCPDGQIFGTIAIPVHFHPQEEAKRVERLRLLDEAGATLESYIKE